MINIAFDAWSGLVFTVSSIHSDRFAPLQDIIILKTYMWKIIRIKWWITI